MHFRLFSALSSILLANFLSSSAFANPNKDLAAEIKKEVLQREELEGKEQYRLLLLAQIYLGRGLKKSASKAYKDSLKAARQLPDGANEVPSIMIAWAVSLAPNDKISAETIVRNALRLTEEMPRYSEDRINALFDAQDYYTRTENKTKETAQLNQLDATLRDMESEASLTNDGIIVLANALNKMAIACPSAAKVPTPLYAPSVMAPPFAFIKPLKFDEKDFKIVESYKLRAMTQLEKLPVGAPSRVEGQRALAIWYRKFGMKEQERFHTEKLIEQLHTTDRAKLFPQPPPCPACGMG